MKKRIITAIASVFLLATLAVPASAQEASVNGHDITVIKTTARIIILTASAQTLSGKNI
ncbi:hypothetical protein [Paenibacillus sp. PCH8]|uniref:hypothetical protein n=1 Tax=Paenibacillus sp. PCH8 TaxID=2066524 RepID=UPI0015E3D998|nr:hypothetical protein [Paenibacillus sp. PCH8]